MRADWLTGASGALIACVCAMLGPAAAAAAETRSTSFSEAGEHQFVVPAGVTSVQVMLVGGSGGEATGFAPGGSGGTVTATLAVSPGETLFAEVAGDGYSSELPTLRGLGGFGGGGNGGGDGGLGIRGGGGGGASDVRTCPVTAPASCGGQPTARLEARRCRRRWWRRGQRRGTVEHGGRRRRSGTLRGHGGSHGRARRRRRKRR